ncbi:serine/threonine-protein kinase [Ruania alba]|uniref:non-specific serine/threonine protein kinase n=1 Tax=Ruania alba TaxID=648782 RepID=A0A1H5L9A1_9MICO|nr:serine/threonine-protein kinase [Ruania alba]SEE73639.1 Protein kinase domain-containing protein [Ruania alba]
MVERIGRYRLEEVIGIGSFATVHRGVDDRLEDTIVVKLLAENHSLNPEVRERFIAEGRSLRRVRSPHVVTVHDLGESDRQQPYLVLEHADRGTLAARVASLRAKGWTASPEELLATARTLAAAIEAVHRAHLVHRDLSPGNVLLTTARGPEGVTPDGGPPAPSAGTAGPLVQSGERLLVADLGMCKDLALNSGLTVAGGTSGFRPPEQRDGPGIVDARADLWSLSALMFWLAEGAEVPEAFTAALRVSMAENPEDRHPDVTGWLAAVEGALAPEPAASEPDAPHVGPFPDARRRGGLVVALATLAVLVAAGIGLALGALLFRDDGQPPASTADASVAIDGPSQLTVGEPAEFTAVVEGVQTMVWALPNGTYAVDEEAVTLTPRGPGIASITLNARTPAGTELEAVHEVEVTE